VLSSPSSTSSLSTLPSPTTHDPFADAAGRHVSSDVSSAGRDGEDDPEWRWRFQGRSMGLAKAMRGEYGWLFYSTSFLVDLSSKHTHTYSPVFLSVFSSSLADGPSLDLDLNLNLDSNLYHHHPLHDHH
jgi:hypothetical protein